MRKIKDSKFTPRRSFISRLFLTPKKSGGFRAILDLSKLNKWVVKRHFKMDHIQNITPLIQEGDYLGSIDISQAYNSISIKQSDRNFLRFFFKNQMYRYKVLPNGISSGPRLFTRILKVVCSFLREKFKVGFSFYI